LKKKGIDNIYTLMGSELHNGIEQIYKNELNIGEFKKGFENVSKRERYILFRN